MDKFSKYLSKETLEYYYNEQHYNLKQMLPIIGCKSDITASKVLRHFGIDTNRNKRTALEKRKGMSDADHRKYLEEEYIWKKRSINSLAEEFGVSHVIITRYLKKYNIPIRNKKEADANFQESVKRKNFTIQNGYVAYRSHNKYIYQHRLVVEQAIGRKLTKNEIVHHRDKNKLNNSITNLILLSNSEHRKLHALLEKGLDEYEAEKGVKIIWAYSE